MCVIETERVARGFVSKIQTLTAYSPYWIQQQEDTQGINVEMVWMVTLVRSLNPSYQNLPAEKSCIAYYSATLSNLRIKPLWSNVDLSCLKSPILANQDDSIMSCPALLGHAEVLPISRFDTITSININALYSEFTLNRSILSSLLDEVTPRLNFPLHSCRTPGLGTVLQRRFKTKAESTTRCT